MSKGYVLKISSNNLMSQNNVALVSFINIPPISSQNALRVWCSMCVFVCGLFGSIARTGLRWRVRAWSAQCTDAQPQQMPMQRVQRQAAVPLAADWRAAGRAGRRGTRTGSASARLDSAVPPLCHCRWLGLSHLGSDPLVSGAAILEQLKV